MKKNKIRPALFLFILIISLNTSCKKDDPKPEGLTIGSLYGNWVFLSLVFNGNTTFSCDTALNKVYDFIVLDFYGVKYNFWNGKSIMTLNNSCLDIGDEPWQKDYSFSFADSIINFNDEWEFKLLNISPFEYINTSTNKKVQSEKMTIKLLYSSFPDIPVNGIYTLGKNF